MYRIFGPVFKRLKIGKLDINTWTRRDYLDWYRNLVLKAKDKKDIWVIFKGTMQWTKALYKNDEFTNIGD